MNKEKIITVVDVLKKVNNVIIITHKSPDADTLGSAVALCLVLRKLGKCANLVVEKDISPRIEFLLEAYENLNFEPQYAISVDISSNSLIPEQVPKKIDICIDHHATNSIMADYKLVIEDAAATGEIVFEIIKEMGIPLCKTIAKCLYAAIASDTGCFKYSNTTKKSHLITVELMDYLEDFAKINQKMFEFESIKDFKLKQMIFANTEFFYNGTLAIAEISKNMLDELGVTLEQVDVAMVSELAKIEGVKVSALLKEKDDGVKVSLRTAEGYNAAEIAAMWGGGGHKRASGCMFEESLRIAKQKIIDGLKIILLEGNNGD
ncbi:MAG: bifunctional oligoribonuclease/PAP phosphatase NrnA [Oscillospiraceae bacterium]